MRPSTRFEIKYRVAPEDAAAICAWIPRHMEPDAHGEGGTAAYDVHSLYLDSADWSLYRDTRNGAYARVKIRARRYTFAADAPVFLELKGREGEAMTKRRVELCGADAERILDGDLPREGLHGPALDAFRTEVDRRHAYPRAWVTYRRSAWVGGERGLVRLTLDEHIRCAPPSGGLNAPPAWWYLPEVKGLVVVEVKYSGSYPRWIAELVRRFGLERRSMSKYRHAVDVLRALPARAAGGV